MAATGRRTVAFPKSDSGKGMNRPDEVEQYVKRSKGGNFRFTRLAREALELNPRAGEIVDIGTGPGYLAVELAKASGKRVRAIDLAPNMLRKTEELAARRGVEIQTIEADCAHLPLPDHSQDLVTSSNLIHMLEDPTPLFREIRRIGRPGGNALVVGFRRDTWRIIRWLAALDTRLASRRTALDGMGAVLEASFTQAELGALLETVGFKSFRVVPSVIGLKVSIEF